MRGLLFAQNETAGISSIQGWGEFLISLKKMVIISLLAISV